MRILIADDNQFVRRAIVGLLAQQDGIEVCGEASDSADAIQKATELQPDMILLDISMPGRNGLETARVLKQKFPETKILIVSQHDPKQMLARSLEVGASGCIEKARLAIDLLPMIRGLQKASCSHVPR
ncbi:MAG TPA: response regulator transcription factor [Terriglobales bacterium]|nr:response regulator transcription factor [Terriglobales bacterium]